jgi:hypothetical protein
VFKDIKANYKTYESYITAIVECHHKLINYNIAQKLFEGICVPVFVEVEAEGKKYTVHSFCHNIPSTHPTEGYTVVKHIICPGMSQRHKSGPWDNIQPYVINDHYLILPNIAMIINTNYHRLEVKNNSTETAVILQINGKDRFVKSMNGILCDSQALTVFTFNLAIRMVPPEKRISPKSISITCHHFIAQICAQFDLFEPNEEFRNEFQDSSLEIFCPTNDKQQLTDEENKQILRDVLDDMGVTYTTAELREYGISLPQGSCDIDHLLSRIYNILNGIFAIWPCSHSANMYNCWERKSKKHWCFGYGQLKYVSVYKHKEEAKKSKDVTVEETEDDQDSKESD